jgi:hypothetical protein
MQRGGNMKRWMEEWQEKENGLLGLVSKEDQKT